MLPILLMHQKFNHSWASQTITRLHTRQHSRLQYTHISPPAANKSQHLIRMARWTRNLKHALTSFPILAHYSLNAKTRVVVDTSPGQFVQSSSKNRLTNLSVQSLMAVGLLPTLRESMAKSKKKPCLWLQTLLHVPFWQRIWTGNWTPPLRTHLCS